MKKLNIDWRRVRVVAAATFWDSIAPMAVGGFLGAISAGRLLTRPALELGPFDRVLFVLLVVGAALVATLAKHKDQAAFGFAELSFGIAVAWSLASRQLGTDPMANGLATLAAVYVCSRGMQNLTEGGRKKFAEDKRRSQTTTG